MDIKCAELLWTGSDNWQQYKVSTLSSMHFDIKMFNIWEGGKYENKSILLMLSQLHYIYQTNPSADVI